MRYKHSDTETFDCVCSMNQRDVLIFRCNICNGQVYDLHTVVLDYHNIRLPLPEVLREQRTYLSALEAFLAGSPVEYINHRSSSDDLSIF